MTKFAYTILSVKDVDRARKFYEEYFQQEIEVDMDKLIGFKSGLALWEADDMAQQPGLGQEKFLRGRGGMEIEFHTEDIETLFSRLENAGVEIVHGILAHPWEQRVFRCLDFDGHCLEVDETLGATAQRLVGEGRSLADIAALFGVSEKAVADMVKS